MVKYLNRFIPEFSVKSGGMTTIDITHAGIDKAHGVHKAMELFNLELSDITFVGDALYEGGNDAPAKATGVDTVEVKSLDDTKAFIRSII
jgi:hydroxymethylpyrimidine pyrophosphatase-like HAD family hydrolase